MSVTPPQSPSSSGRTRPRAGTRKLLPASAAAPLKYGARRYNNRSRLVTFTVGLLAALFAVSACSSGQAASEGTSSPVRLGYFPNITHAAAVLGVADGQFQAALGDAPLQVQTFNSGNAAVEALNAGALDATFIGPNPALNAWVNSGGQAVKIVAGAASGGAQFVVAPGVTDDPASLTGKSFATPSLGNTQDVALRYWLSGKGLSAPPDRVGDVNILPQENSQTLDLFRQGQIDGAWLPEPWASRLVVEADAEVLVDEADLWKDGQFVTTHLIVSQTFLESRPDQVEALIRGLVASVDAIQADPDQARNDVDAAISAITGSSLDPQVLARSWDNLTITVDPIASTLQENLDHAVAVGVSQPASLDGIYDLTILNRILVAAGKRPVSAAGLGAQ